MINWRSLVGYILRGGGVALTLVVGTYCKMNPQNGPENLSSPRKSPGLALIGIVITVERVIISE